MSNLVRKAIYFLIDHKYLVLRLLTELFILLQIIILIRMRRKKQQWKEQTIREEKSRRLIERISNPEYLKREGISYNRSYPYKVSDGGAPIDENAGKKDFMLKLSVQTLMLTREYLLPVSDGIMIGRAASNTICIDDSDLAEHQCRIFMNNKQLCLESLSSVPTVIQRRNEQYTVGDTPVELANSDVICIGDDRVILSF